MRLASLRRPLLAPILIFSLQRVLLNLVDVDHLVAGRVESSRVGVEDGAQASGPLDRNCLPERFGEDYMHTKKHKFEQSKPNCEKPRIWQAKGPVKATQRSRLGLEDGELWLRCNERAEARHRRRVEHNRRRVATDAADRTVPHCAGQRGSSGQAWAACLPLPRCRSLPPSSLPPAALQRGSDGRHHYQAAALHFAVSGAAR